MTPAPFPSIVVGVSVGVVSFVLVVVVVGVVMLAVVVLKCRKKVISKFTGKHKQTHRMRPIADVV